MSVKATGRTVDWVSNSPGSVTWAALVVVGLLLVSGLAGAALAEGASDALVAVPRPDLSGTEPLIRRELERLRAGFDELSSGPGVSDEKLAAASGDLAAIYHAHEFHLAAEVAYRNAQQLRPGEPQWAYELGILYQDLGDLEAALMSFDQVLVVEPNDLPSLLRSGEQLLQLDRPSEARQRFEQARRQSPISAAALQGLGKVAAAEADFAAAVKYFQQALELQPQATAIHYPLAQALRRLGHLDGAKRHLGLLGEVDVDFEDPRLDRLARIVKVSAANVVLAQVESETTPLRELVGYAVAHLVDTPGVVGYLTTAAARREADSGELSAAVWARLHYMISGLLIAQGRDELALEHLDSAIRRAAVDRVAPAAPVETNLAMSVLVEANLDLAGTLMRLDRQREALPHYTEVLDHSPDSSVALTGRAMAHIQLGEDADAIPDLRRLAVLEPENGAPHLHLGMVHQRLGKADQARGHYRAALELQLDGPEEALVRGNLAALRIARGELTSALEELELAVGLDPDSVDLVLRLADTLGLADRYVDAADRYATVIERRPRHEAARVGEASALILAQRYEQAKIRLETGVEALPDSRRLKLLLARLLAVAPANEVRDGERSLALARELFRWRQNLLHGETMAMALAQLGRFVDAVELQSNLLRAVEHGKTPRAEQRLRDNLDRYRAGRRCCAQDAYVVLLPTVEPARGS